MEYKLGEIARLVEEAATKMGVNPEMAKAILVAENTGSGNFNPEQIVRLDTTSPKGARGFGQVMPDTWAGLVREGYLTREDRPNTKEGQVKALVAALAEKRKYAGDDPVRLAIAYNAGPARLKEFNGDVSKLPLETQGYIPKVLKNLKSTTSSTYPSGVFDNVLTTVQNATNQGSELLGKIQGLTGAFTDEAGVASDALKTKGDAEARLSLVKGNQAVQRNNYVRSLLTSMGLDAESHEQSFQQTMGAAALAQKEVQALQPQIQAARSVSFTDDPLAWVKAQFDLQGLTTKHNAAAKIFNDNVSAVGALQQVASRQVQLQPGVNSDSIGKEAAIEAEVKLAQAKVNQLDIARATKQAQLAAYGTQMQFLGHQVQNAFALAKLTADKNTEREVLNAKTKDEQNLVVLNAWRERIGTTPYTMDDLKLLPKKDLEDQLRYALVPHLAIASEPGDSLNVLHDRKGYNVFRAQMPEQGRKFLDQFTLQAQAQARAMKLQPGNSKLSDDELFTKAGNELAKTWNLERSRRDYSDLRSDNPFAMNASIYAQAPELKTNSVAQYVTATPNGGAGLGPKDILSYAVAQVQTGKKAQEVAAEVRQFFEAGMKSQFEAYRMNLLGFDIKNPDTNKAEFPISGNVFGVWDRFLDPRKSNAGVKNFDMFNEAEITQFLVLNTIQARYRGGADPLGEMMKNNGMQTPGATKP
jgi:hypothetical protein